MEIVSIKEAISSANYANVKVKIVDIDKQIEGKRKDSSTWKKQVLKIQDETSHCLLMIWDREPLSKDMIGHNYLVKSVIMGESEGQKCLKSGKYFALTPIVEEKKGPVIQLEPKQFPPKVEPQVKIPDIKAAEKVETPKDIKDEWELEKVAEQTMWAEKELREIRGKCVMYAISCFPPKNNEDGKSELLRAEEVIAVADAQFVDYIYNGLPKLEEPF